MLKPHKAPRHLGGHRQVINPVTLLQMPHRLCCWQAGDRGKHPAGPPSLGAGGSQVQASRPPVLRCRPAAQLPHSEARVSA